MTTDFTSLVIVGAIVSLLIQFIKNTVGTSEYGTLAMVVVISLLGAWAYMALADTKYWDTFLKVLLGAGGIYSLLIQRFESKLTTDEVKGMFKS